MDFASQYYRSIKRMITILNNLVIKLPSLKTKLKKIERFNDSEI
jgi:hypothetical protein